MPSYPLALGRKAMPAPTRAALISKRVAPVVLAQLHLVEVEAPAQKDCPFLADRGERSIGLLYLLQPSKRNLARMVMNRGNHGGVQREDDP